MILWHETKSVPISRQMVWEAYKKVKANKGSAGVDAVSMEDFDVQRAKHLYKLWNRLSSGSYFPPAVQEVEIPKKDGKVRKLGIPTIGDRIAQMVVKQYLEPRFEEIFLPESYGYRPAKSAHGALEAVRENCRRTDWVIDLDIKEFFDNISHEKLMLALERHVSEKWCLFYIKRWLQAPVCDKTGKLFYRQGKGTPQGGVISPLLANLFLHYAMDKWLKHNHPCVQFVRYADDAILHARTKSEAERVLQGLKERMQSCGLELHSEKTKLVYCRDYRRQEKHQEVKFDFLGYSFQPRPTMSKRTGKLFLGFDCAISIHSKKCIADKLEVLEKVIRNHKSIVSVAGLLNPYLRGWIHYYGKFRLSAMQPVFQRLRERLIRWVRKRYKRYKTRLLSAYNWIERIRSHYPYLFYHWQLGLE